jgi:hypothetical protein
MKPFASPQLSRDTNHIPYLAEPAQLGFHSSQALLKSCSWGGLRHSSLKGLPLDFMGITFLIT